LLALRLVGGHQAQSSRLVAHHVLGEVAHREPRGLELPLRQWPEEIRLIPARVAPAPEQEALRLAVAGYTRVVAGRDRGRVPRVRALQQGAELHLAIARHARHRRAARRALLRERLAHRALELAPPRYE